MGRSLFNEFNHRLGSSDLRGARDFEGLIAISLFAALMISIVVNRVRDIPAGAVLLREQLINVRAATGPVLARLGIIEAVPTQRIQNLMDAAPLALSVEDTALIEQYEDRLDSNDPEQSKYFSTFFPMDGVMRDPVKIVSELNGRMHTQYIDFSMLNLMFRGGIAINPTANVNYDGMHSLNLVSIERDPELRADMLQLFRGMAMPRVHDNPQVFAAHSGLGDTPEASIHSASASTPPGV